VSDAELSSQRNRDNCASDVVIIYSRSRATGSMPWSSMQRSYSALASCGSAGGRCRQVHRSAAVALSWPGGLRASGFYFPARLQPALTVQCAWHCSAWQAVGARIVAALARRTAGTAITVCKRKQASKKVPGIQPWRTCVGDGDEGELKRFV